MNSSSENQDFHQEINELAKEACRHPKGSNRRQRCLNEIVRRVTRSKKLWRENVPYYQDALHKTWDYFCQNVCEATTAKEAYNPDKANLITWLNNYLRWRLKDFELEDREQNRIFRQPVDDEDILSQLAAPEPDEPDILQEFQEWLETDEELNTTHLQGKAHITAKVMIMRRLIYPQSWEELSQEFGVSVSTLSGFYQRKCMPLVHKFAKEYGYKE